MISIVLYHICEYAMLFNSFILSQDQLIVFINLRYLNYNFYFINYTKFLLLLLNSFNMSNFDVLRDVVFGWFSDFSWTSKFTLAFKEFYEEHTVTWICIYRIILQTLRSKLENASVILSDVNLMKLLRSSLTGSQPVLKALSIEIFKILTSQLDSLMIDFSELGIEVSSVCDLFEENIVTEPLVSTYSAGLLHEIMQKGGSKNTEFILKRYSDVNKISLIQQLLDINKKKDDIKKVDGTNFGWPIMGFYDYPLILLERLFAKNISDTSKSADQKKDFANSLNTIKSNVLERNYELSSGTGT